MGYYDDRPEIYRGTAGDFIKKHLVVYISSWIFIFLAIFIAINTLNPENPNMFLVFSITLSSTIPLNTMHVLAKRDESKKYKESLKRVEEWENQPEKIEERKEMITNIKTFHYAGGMSGNFYSLKEYVPEVAKDLKTIFLQDDKIVITQLSNEQKEELIQTGKVTIHITEKDLKLAGHVQPHANKLFVNI
jgi:hypothetical protein